MIHLSQQFGRILKRAWRQRIVRFAFVLSVMACLAYAVLLLALLLKPFSIEELTENYSESRRIFDRQGRLLREIVNSDGNRAQWVHLPEISPLAAEATIAVEDARFYTHPGVDVLAIGRALWQNIIAGQTVSGASTLTMQLSRLIYGHSHTIRGKLEQAFDALRIERSVSKQTILEHYLNRAPYGAGTVGIEAASRKYFGKSSVTLSLAETALLAGLPKAPGDLNPLRNMEAAQKRQQFVLRRMLVNGAISQEEFDRACREQLRIEEQPPLPAAMHFTEYVLSQALPDGNVMTTLDSDLQHQLERLVKDHVESLRFDGLTDAAALVLDNRDCAILAMVGSANYWEPGSGSVNGVLARRQPGSTLKPFTYALAFERGFTPASVVEDIRTQYLGAEGTLFIPNNYSQQFYGPVLMREALGRSLNIPAIRTLNEVGVNRLLTRLQATGFASLDQDPWYYGLGLTLGGGEVTLLELAQGFAMFARGGLACKANAFRDTPAEESIRVFSEEICFLITEILSDKNLRIRAFGITNPLLFGFPIAIKTGTSANWRDNWVVGYTPRHTIAVWAGNFEGHPMNQMSGATGAGPLFHNIARFIAEQGAIPQIPTRPDPPEGVELITVCALSGMTLTQFCPYPRSIYVLKKDTPRPPCDMHRLARIDKRNGLLASERCPSAFVEEKVFETLPPVYADWQASQGIQPPPARYSPYCPEKGITANALVITNPRKDEVYLIEPGYDRATQTLQLNGEVDPALPEVKWFVDGQLIATAPWPYDAVWPISQGHHRLEMRGGGMRSDPVDIEVR